MDGVLQFNSLVLQGLPAAAMKWLVEHMQVPLSVRALRRNQTTAHRRPLASDLYCHLCLTSHGMHAQVHAARGSSLHAAAWGYFEAVGVWLGARLFLQGL